MKNLIFLLALILFSVPGRSEIKLPAIFTDNMVIQRDMPIEIWGWADKNEKITVRFNGQVGSARAGKEGAWSIQLKPMSANTTPLSLEVIGKNTIVMNNLLIGDVWICSGQSNMQWTLRSMEVGESESREAKFTDLRMFTVTREMALTTRDDLNGTGWKTADGEQVIDFSAVAYYFGKHLLKETEIPIGLISTSWGGTNVEAWTSMETLRKYDHIVTIYDGLDKTIDYSQTAVEKRREKKMEMIKEVAYEGTGLPNEWQKSGSSYETWDWTILPQEKENQLFDTFDGAIWFRKSFDLPTPFQDKDIQFNLGMLYDHGIVWVNGQKIGESFEPNRWRNYTAGAEYLKPHGNEIVVRLFDYANGGGIITDPLSMNFHPVDDAEISQLLCGEWQYKISYSLDTPLDLAVYSPKTVHVNGAPSSLFNQMIHPLLNLSITGAIWYQGESNAGRAFEYASLFPDMIKDWRMHWAQGDFPFLFVQLAAYERPATQTWPELREAQRGALNLQNTGMAVTTDIGHPTNIHPQNKWDVGKRLALPALNFVYKKDITYSGPVLEKAEVNQEKMKITFSLAGEGLKVTGDYGYLMGFEVSSDNIVFELAMGRILDARTVEVWSEKIRDPKYVRYAWRNYPVEANLFNSEDLPASPFRTGTWEWITKGNKYGQ